MDPSTLGDRTAPILAPRPFGFAQGDKQFGAQPSRSSRHPDLGLVLVGPPLTAEQWKLVGEDLRSGVICVQNLDDANLAVLYRGAEALIFPSLDEGFGWPVLEANACGCPAIISRRGSLPEVGADAAVYIDPADEAGAIHVIDAFLRQSPAEREQSRQSALRNAGRFSQDVTIQAYLGLYQRAIEDTRSRRR